MPYLSRPYLPRAGLGPIPVAILLSVMGSRGQPGRLRAGRLSVETICRLVATYRQAGEAVTFMRPAGIR
jgi:hypothetical protein